jgi:hypothetical protein
MTRNERITICYFLGMAATVTFMLASSPTPTAEEARLPDGWGKAPTIIVQSRTSAPGAMEAPWQYETDPFRRCALKAVAGEFGILKDWQLYAYKWGLAHGVTCCGQTKITSYGPWEKCGTHTASGERFSTDFVSVPPKRIPLGTIIWTHWGLRYAMDTGGAVKAHAPYIKPGENMNLDYATMREVHTQHWQPWAVVKRETGWNWYGLRKWGEYSKRGKR